MRFASGVFSGLCLLWCVAAFGAAPYEQSFCGVGVSLKEQGSSIVIEGVIPGGAAEKAGVPAGCRIVTVDGRPVKGMALKDVSGLLRGAEGTVVTIAVVQDLGLTGTYALTRIRMEAVGADTLAGTYGQQDDPSILVIIERVAANHFRVSCPRQHWSGMGLIGNNCLKGVFQMEDHPDVLADFRGAAGFLRIDFQLGERLLLRSRFNFFDRGDKMVEKTLVRRSAKSQP